MSNTPPTQTRGIQQTSQNSQQNAALPQQQQQPQQQPQQQYQQQPQQQYQQQPQQQSNQPDTQVALQNNSQSDVMMEFMRRQQEQTQTFQQQMFDRQQEQTQTFQRQMFETMANLALDVRQQSRPLPVSQAGPSNSQQTRKQIAEIESRISTEGTTASHQTLSGPSAAYPPPLAVLQYNPQSAQAPVRLPSLNEADCLSTLKGMYNVYNKTLKDVNVEIPEITQDMVDAMLYHPSCTPGWNNIKPLLQQARDKREAHLAARSVPAPTPAPYQGPRRLDASIHNGEHNQGQQQQQPQRQQQQPQQPQRQQQQPQRQQQQQQQQQSFKGKEPVRSGPSGLEQSLYSTAASSPHQTNPSWVRPKKLSRKEILNLPDDAPDYQPLPRNRQPKTYKPPSQFAGQFDVHPDYRPGGMLTVRMYKFPRSLDPDEYPRPAHKLTEPNTFYIRNSWLGLAADEHQYPCWGVYALTESNANFMRCPYINNGNKCRNNHRLSQAVVDFAVAERGVKHKTIQAIIDSIALAGGQDIPEIRMPSFPPSFGLTPNQKLLAQAASSSVPISNETASMSSPGTSTPGAAAPPGQNTANTNKWQNFTAHIT